MPISSSRIQRAAALWDAAAFSPDGLIAALHPVADAMDYDGVHLTRVSEVQPFEFIVDPRMVSLHRAYFDEGWSEIDLWTQTAAKVAVDGVALSVDDLIDRETQATNDYFMGFCREWGVERQVARSFKVLDERWVCTFWRSARRGDTGQTEKRQLSALMPAAERAVLHATLLQQSKRTGMIEGLERAGRAALLIDHRGRVIHENAHCARLFDVHFGIRDGQLFARNLAADAELKKLAAFAQGRARMIAPLQNFAIPRDAPLRPIIVNPTLLGMSGLDLLPGGRVLITLVDLEAPSAPSLDMLRSTFALTRREADIARRIATGASLDAIAAGAGLKLSTARQILKALLAKTDTHKQAELVALLARMNEG